jgi:CoA:oxalate CoA-transferase
LATRDGWIIVAAGNDSLFAELVAALGTHALAQDPRFASNDDRVRNVEDLKRELEAALAVRSSEVWLSLLEAAGVPCGPIQDVGQVVEHPQVAARNMVVGVDDPVAGRLRLAGNPIKLSGVEDPDSRPPAPELDEHRAAILAELEEASRP